MTRAHRNSGSKQILRVQPVFLALSGNEEKRKGVHDGNNGIIKRCSGAIWRYRTKIKNMYVARKN
jgi:hypothetical protein